MKDDRLYLAYIQECIERIERYSAGERDAFMADTLVQDAILRNLQTLAESTQRLSPELKARHPGVDWRGVAAFRNVVVHNYLGIDLAQIWDIVRRDLPALKREVAAALQSPEE